MKKERKKVDKKRISLFVIAVIVVVILLVNFIPPLVSLIFGNSISEDVITITPDAVSECDFGTYGKDIVVFNAQGLKAYNQDGEYLWDIPAKTYSPFLHTNGEYMILTDIGGGEIRHIKDGEQDFIIQSSQPVQTANVSKKGYVLAITSENGYKSSVSVYNENGEHIYQWYSGDIFVTDAKISPDHKKMAVAGIKTSGQSISSVVIFFEFKTENPSGQVILDEKTAYQLVYIGKDIALLTDSGILKIAPNGDLKAEYDFKGRSLNAFDMEDPEKITLALSGETSRDESKIVILNKKLKERMTCEVPVEVTMLDQKGKSVVAGGHRKLFLITSGGRVKASGNMVKDAKYVKLADNEKNILTLSGSYVNIYPVKFGR